jgi:hypothetical protein
MTRPAVAEFAHIAEALCDAIADSRRSGLDRLRIIHGLLPRAYAAALALPLSPVADERPPADAGRADTLPSGLNGLADVLGGRCSYREVFDPYSEKEEGEVVGDLIDDFQDIHRDLSSGLTLWREGKTADAAWEWRFSFETHWGEHATSAIRALYALSAWRDVPWPP